jgi:hypothetical protein
MMAARPQNIESLRSLAEQIVWAAGEYGIGDTLAGATAFVGFDADKEHFTNYFLCTGSDDQVEIALADAYVAALGGGDLKFELGTYSMNAQWQPSEFVNWIGSGQVDATGSSNATVFNIQDNVSFGYIETSNVSIHNILFYGHWETGRAVGIRIEDTGTNIDNVQIKNCRFKGFIYGIHFLNAFGSGSGNSIEECSFDGPTTVTSHGIYSDDLSNWTLKDCWFNIREYANNTGIYFHRSATESYPHTERILLLNCGFNGFNTNNIAGIKIDILRAGDGRGELDGLNIIGGYIENCWAGIHVVTDGVRALVNLYGTEFFSAYTHNILIDAGQDDTYIVADNCYQLDTVTNTGGSHITVKGEYAIINDPTIAYIPVNILESVKVTGDTPTVNQTDYFPVMGECVSTVAANENRVRTFVGKAGMLRNLRIHSLPGANNATATVRIDGAPTAITTVITGGAGEGIFSDLANTVAIAADSYITVSVASGAAAPTLYWISLEYLC